MSIKSRVVLFIASALTIPTVFATIATLVGA